MDSPAERRGASELRVASRRALAILLLVFAAALALAPSVRWIGRLAYDAYSESFFEDDHLAALTLDAAPALLVCVASMALALALLRGSERALRRATLAVVLILAVGLPIGASRTLESDPLLRLSPAEREALTTLLNIKEFQMQLVGFDVHESRGYLAMRTLHRSPYAAAAFEELLHHGTVAGRLYGLCGVYRTNPALFQTAKTTIVSSGTVPRFWGCTIEDVDVARLIESPNGVRLARNETVRHWADCCAHAQYGRDFDIAGGMLPRMFYEDLERPNSTTARAEPSR